MLKRQVQLARGIARFIDAHGAYELLPPSTERLEERLQGVFVIVLFWAKGEGLNGDLVRRINGTGRVYVSGTVLEGRRACRFAVANWGVDVERDLGIVRGVLEEVAGG